MVGGGAGEGDPVGAAVTGAGFGERLDGQAVPAGQDLLVEGGGRLACAGGRIEEVVAALDPLARHRALAVLRRGERSTRGTQHAAEEGGDALRGGEARGRAGIGAEQEGVVVEHPLVVWVGPVPAGGVPEEATLHVVAQVRAGNGGEGAPGEGCGVVVPTFTPILQEPEDGCDRELWRPAEPAVGLVLVTDELGDDRGPRRGVGQITGRRHHLGREGGRDGGRVRVDLIAPVRPCVEHGVEHLRERGAAVGGHRRPIGTGVERLALGRDEHIERPAEPAREGGSGGEVARVDVGILLAVDLDRDETGVDPFGDSGIAEALPRHHVAPVAGCIADRHQERHATTPRLLERFLAPLPPVDRVVRVRTEVGAHGIPQRIDHTPA